MFDNIGTALVQAVGFFTIFGYFVFQLLFDGKKSIKSQENLTIKKLNQTKDLNKKSKKKGLFFSKAKPLKDEEIPKKRGWFN